MGLTDKLFNKKEEDKKPIRDVGSNFDKSDAEKIFDALDRVEAKPKKDIPENLKREFNQTKEISGLMEEAQRLMMSEKFSEAIVVFKKVITIDPNNGQAYECLADIYHLQDNKDSEIEILKSAIKNVNNNKTKNDLMKRLKEIN